MKLSTLKNDEKIVTKGNESFEKVYLQINLIQRNEILQKKKCLFSQKRYEEMKLFTKGKTKAIIQKKYKFNSKTCYLF